MSQAPTKYRVTQNGEPVSGGKVYFYESGTSTPLATYQDSSLSTLNANPVILDANGEANIYLGDASYRETVYTSDGQLIRTRDGIRGDMLTISAADARYIRIGESSGVSVTTKTVIANVRTYEVTVTGFASYTSGVTLNIIPDVVSVSDVGYKINVNGLGDKSVLNGIGGKPTLVAGQQAIIIYDGTNFVNEPSSALLAGLNSVEIVTTGGGTPSTLTATASAGVVTIDAGGAGNPEIVVKSGNNVKIDSLKTTLIDGSKIVGDFTNAPRSIRPSIQTNVTNGVTNFQVIPNGTATVARVSVFNDSAPDSATASTTIYADAASGGVSVTKPSGASGAIPFVVQVPDSTGVSYQAANISSSGASFFGEGVCTVSANGGGGLYGALAALSPIGLPAYDFRYVGGVEVSRITHTATSVEFSTGSPSTPRFAIDSATGEILSRGSKIGYASGVGGSVSQVTSKSTGVSINKPSGAVTTASDSLGAGASVVFQVTNSFVTQSDTVSLNAVGSSGLNYTVLCRAVVSGSFYIYLKNDSGSPLSESIQIQFNIHKGSAA